MLPKKSTAKPVKYYRVTIGPPPSELFVKANDPCHAEYRAFLALEDYALCEAKEITAEEYAAESDEDRRVEDAAESDEDRRVED